ncbi:MAG: cytochrome C oxidase subunit IV family protein [Acidimicrobiales bacterium]
MSNDTATVEHAEHTEHGEHKDHLSFSGAIKVAIILAIITFIETMTYFVDFGAAAEPVIIVAMILKFATVVGYFMHLKFDNKMFTFLFMVGIVLTLGATW